MIRKRGAGVMTAIIVVSVFGWVAIVGLVIKPNIWVGSVLSLFGGGLIGLVAAYLMRKWWFKEI